VNKIAIALMTKDRCELTKRTIAPLLQPAKFDLWWIDGSDTHAGQNLLLEMSDPTGNGWGEAKLKHNDSWYYRGNVKGGADPAIANALAEMLKNDYTHVGIVENDVLLHADWYGPTMALFDRGTAEGLAVGAASARSYVDRILVQRDGYAVMHNLGWGMQILTREAAQLTLKHMRTHWTSENRRAFAKLSGIDIGSYWAFRTNEHWTTPDWGNDAVLASHGFASLALTPSPVEMIGQKPSLRDQGLELATKPVEDRRNDEAFGRFAVNTRLIRDGSLSLNGPPVRFRGDNGEELIFSHQLDGLPGASWQGDWKLKWSPGLGGFAARGFAGASFSAMISGPCKFMVMGGEKGGQIAVEDIKSGYTVRPQLLPEVSQNVTQVVAPCGVSSRTVRLSVVSGSCIFYGLSCQEPQLTVNGYSFDHSKLWPGS
jgi:hypothetical protein